MIKLEQRKSLTFAQSNSLIEARYSMTVGEMQLVFSILSMIRKGDKDFKEYVIKVQDLSSLLEKSTKNIYREIDNITDRLLSRVLYLEKGNDKFLKSNWLASAEYDEGLLRVSISPKLKPYLLNLKGRFKQFELIVILGLRGSYTIRIYMLLKQYENIGVREFEVLEFKKKLDLSSKMYSEFKYVKKFVINKSQNEFNKKDKETGLYYSDINFKLEKIRTGRKITRLRFIIIKQKTKHYIELENNLDNNDNNNEKSSENIPNDKNNTGDKEVTETIKSLIQLGITKQQALNFQTQHGDEYLQEKIDYSQKQDKAGKIKSSLSGYLIKAIENDWKSQDQVKAIQKKAEEEQQDQQKKWEEKLKLECNEAVKLYIDQQNDTQKKQLKADFEKSNIFKHKMQNDHYVNGLYQAMKTFDEVLQHKETKRFIKRFIFSKYLEHSAYLKSLEAWKKHHNIH